MRPAQIEAQYDDPRLVAVYDRLNAGDRDFRFYLERIGTSPCRVLDLGCGTGRFALMLARQGHRVTAVDPAPAMLDYARARPGAEAVHWQLGRGDGALPGAPFDVVTLTGHAVQCVIGEAALRTLFGHLRACLRPGGVLWFESRNPHPEPWRHWQPHRSVRRLDGLTLWHVLRSVADGVVEFDTHYRFTPGALHLVNHARLFFPSAAVLLACLQAAGFRQVSCLGDWDGAAFAAAHSPEIIVRARA